MMRSVYTTNPRLVKEISELYKPKLTFFAISSAVCTISLVGDIFYFVFKKPEIIGIISITLFLLSGLFFIWWSIQIIFNVFSRINRLEEGAERK